MGRQYFSENPRIKRNLLTIRGEDTIVRCKSDTRNPWFDKKKLMLLGKTHMKKCFFSGQKLGTP